MEKIQQPKKESVEQKNNVMVVVIKPDAISHRDEIIKKFEDEGLVIIKSKKINLGDKFLTEKMYGNLPDDIKEETLNHFRRGQAEVILLGLWSEKQEDILKKVISLTGEKTDPHECDMKSIRSMFGDHEGILTKEGKKYSPNAIHRAKTLDEKETDIDKFLPFLKDDEGKLIVYYI